MIDVELVGGLLKRLDFDIPKMMETRAGRISMRNIVYLMQAFGLYIGYKYNYYLPLQEGESARNSAERRTSRVVPGDSTSSKTDCPSSEPVESDGATVCRVPHAPPNLK